MPRNLDEHEPLRLAGITSDDRASDRPVLGNLSHAGVRARKAPEPEPERDSGEIVHVHVKPGRTAVIGEKAFGDRATLQLARRDAAPPIESGDAEPVNPRRRPVASAIGCETDSSSSWRTDKLIGAAHGAECTSSRAHRDDVTKESATGETHARCERMLELGFTLRPTSEFDNVLEVKPPLFIGA